jgi:hypothetical protein
MDMSGYVLHVRFLKLSREGEKRSGDGGDIEEGMFPLLGFKELREDLAVVHENLFIVPKYVFDKLVKAWWGNDWGIRSAQGCDVQLWYVMVST